MQEWEARMERIEKIVEEHSLTMKELGELSRKADVRMDRHIEFVGGVIVKMERHLEAMAEKMDKSLDTQNEILGKIQASVAVIENNAFGIVARLVKLEERVEKLEKK